MASLGGYGAVAGSASLSGGTTAPGRDFIDLSNPITTAGDVETVDVYLSGTPGATDIFQLKIWRQNGANYDFVGQSQDFTGLANGVNNLTLSAAITVQVGDLIGCFVSANDAIRVNADAPVGDQVSYQTGDESTSQAVSGFTVISSDRALSIEVFGTAGAPSNTITLTDFTDYQVVQRSGGATTNITISGTYTGTPTNIEYRIVNHGTSTAITGHDWQTLEASPTGGTFSGIVAVADGGHWNVDVRFSNDTGVTSEGTARWGIGIIIGSIGQSHGEDMDTDGASLTPNALLSKYNGSWGAHSATGDGDVQFGNSLITALGIPVAIITRCVSGTAIADWYTSAGGAQTNYTNWTTWVTGAGGALESVVWWQGDRDAILQTTASQYQTDVEAMFSAIRTSYGASLPIIVPLLGRDDAAIDADWDAIRQAHVSITDADANAYRVETLDLATEADGQHFTDAANRSMGDRYSNIIDYLNSGSSYWRGPQIASVTKISSTVLDVNLTHNGGTDFTPTTGITGFSVTDDNWSTTKPISSVVRQDASTIRLTLSAALTGTAKLRYLYGGNPDNSGIVKDNSSLTLPLEYNGAFMPPVRVQLSLVDNTDTAEASLTGLKWAFFDEITPDLLNAPVDQGNAETTDASGVLDIPIPSSAKEVGGVGWLIVTNSDGTTTQSPAHKAYCGPVELIQ